MTILTPAECATWCEERGYSTPPHHRSIARGDGYAEYNFRIPKDAGARVALCRVLWQALSSDAGDGLIWISSWGIWPSSEHLPLFNTMRAGFSEHRGLEEASGHAFTADETDDPLSVLIVSCLFLWDCSFYRTDPGFVVLSHDECGTLVMPANQPLRTPALGTWAL